MYRITMLAAFCLALGLARASEAQVYTTYYQPTTTYYQPVTTHYVPAATTACTTCCQPVTCCAPATTTATSYYAATPATTYYAPTPTVTHYAPATTTVVPQRVYYTSAYRPAYVYPSAGYTTYYRAWW